MKFLILAAFFLNQHAFAFQKREPVLKISKLMGKAALPRGLLPPTTLTGKKLGLQHGTEEITTIASSRAHPLPAGYSRSLKRNSVEWKEMPKQRWEMFIDNLPKGLARVAIDGQSKVSRNVANKYARSYYSSVERVPIMGEVVAARTPTQGIFLGDTVFVSADEALQVGSIYDLTVGPEDVTSDRDGRDGYVYQIKGRVKIIGVRDQRFIGIIVEMYGPILRGDLLIAPSPVLVMNAPKAAAQALEGSIMIPHQIMGSTLVADQQTVFVDLGSQDGIVPGNIFRLYQRIDEYSKKEISTKDFIIDAELEVVEVNERFSLAIVLNAKRPLEQGELVVALTDIQDFAKDTELQTLIQDRATISNPDELDQIDSGQALGNEESKELNQLENYKDIERDNRGGEKTGVTLGNEKAPNDGSGNPNAGGATPPASEKVDPNALPVDESVPDAPADGSGAADGAGENPFQEVPESAPANGATGSSGGGTDIQGSSPAPNEPAPVTENSAAEADASTVPSSTAPGAAPTAPAGSGGAGSVSTSGAVQGSAPISDGTSLPTTAPTTVKPSANPSTEVPNDLLEMPPPDAPASN